MTPLASRLALRIRTSGPIGVDVYMAAALGDAEYGYYVTREPIGASADFITAPEISQVFGELVGLWCAVVWRRLGMPSPVQLIEFGPGRGTLLADALRAIGSVAADFARVLKPTLIETCGRLRVAQEAALRAVWRGAQPQWYERFTDVPDHPALIVANEFFDALPVRQFVRDGDGWRERRIGLDETGEGFAFVPGPRVPTPLPDDLLAGVADGEIVECCPAGEQLAAAIGARVARTRGAALIIDYGHAHPQAGETLQALRRHRFADVLDRPGETDLSHHVDFASLAASARVAGCAVYGPVPQGLFLGRLGIAERAERLIAAEPRREAAISGEIRRLVHPGRMGVLFKAMAMTTPGFGAPPGFSASVETGAAHRG